MTISTPPEYHPWTILIRCFSLFCLTGIGDSRFILNRILCFVNLASLYKLVNTTNLLHNFFLSIFINLCMFRATMCPSSGETTVFLRHLILVILCGWLSGMQGGMKHSTLHTRQSSTQNNKYQVSQKHSCFSWWWAHSRPKHVEVDKYTKNKFVHQDGFIYKIIQGCPVNRTLKKKICVPLH